MVMGMGMGTRTVETGWGWGQEPRGLLGMGTNSCPRAAVWYGVVYPASVTAYTYTLVLTTSYTLVFRLAVCYSRCLACCPYDVLRAVITFRQRKPKYNVHFHLQ